MSDVDDSNGPAAEPPPIVDDLPEAHEEVESPAPVTPPAMSDLPEAIGRFQVRAQLGSGAFGTVYRCYDPQLDREVALKVPQAAALVNDRRVQRFLREAKAAAQLRHPNIVPTYEAGHDGTNYYIASAFIEGKTLAHALDGGPLDFRRAARIVIDLAEALAYAHDEGIVHRDVKPANVMLDAEDRPHVMDFGLAARHDVEDTLTQEGTVLGTPAYMAPEQAAGKSGDALPASDQYSLGVVLYELLCAELPFTGPSQIVIFNAIHQEPPRPRKFNPKIPRDLETICLKAMAKHPADRYGDCQELAADLQRWLEGEQIKARRPTFRERVVRWARREPKLAAAGAVTGASLTLAAIVLAILATNFKALADSEGDEKRQAQQAEQEAQTALVAEQEEHTRVRLELYFKLILLVQSKIEEDDPAGALWTLERCPPPYRGWEWNHLWHRGQVGAEAVRFLRGHPGGVWASAFSPDSQRLVCVCQDGTVKVWDVRLGKEVRTFKLKEELGWNSRVAVSADGKRLAVCPPTEGRFGPRVMPAGGEQRAEPPAKPAPKQVTVWDSQKGQQIASLPAPDASMVFLALNTDGSRLAIAAGDWNQPSELKVYDAQTGKETFKFEQPFDGLRNLLFSPDGRLLTVNEVMKTEYQDVQETAEKEGPGGQREAYTVTKKVPFLMGTGEFKVQLWDSQTGKEAISLEGPIGGIQTVVFCPDGKRIAGFGGEMQIVTKKVPMTVLRKVTEQRTVKQPDGTEKIETFQRDVMETVYKEVQEMMHGAGAGANLRIWDAQTGKIIRTLEGFTGHPSALAFSPDCQRLAIAKQDPCYPEGVVELWDLRLGRLVCTLRAAATRPGGPPAELHHISWLMFSPDGRHLAAGTNQDDTVVVWSAHSGRVIVVYTGHNGPVTSVAFSPDGKQVASISDCNQTGKLWDAQTGKEAFSFKTGHGVHGGYGMHGGWGAHGGHGFKGGFSGCAGLGFTPNNQWLLTGNCLGAGMHGCHGMFGGFGDNRMWNRTTGKEFTPPKEAGRALAYSRDGTRFASVADVPTDGKPIPSDQIPEVKVRDTDSGKEICTLKGLRDPVMAVKFSLNGKRLVSLSQEMMNRVKEETRERKVAKDGKEEVVQEKVKVPYQVFSTILRVWDAQTGKEILAHPDASGVFAISADGTRLASATRMPEQEFRGPRPIPAPAPEGAPSTARESDGRIASESLLGGLILLQAPAQERIKQPAKPVPGNGAAQPMPPPRIPEVKVFDTVTGKDLFTLKGFSAEVSKLVFAPTGRHLASVTQGWSQQTGQPVNEVKVWDLQTGKDIITHNDYTGSLAFSPDGMRLAMSSGEPMGTGGVVVVPAAPPGGNGKAPPAPAQPPAPKPPLVKVWDLPTGRELLKLAPSFDRGERRGPVVVAGATGESLQEGLVAAVVLSVAGYNGDHGGKPVPEGYITAVAYSPDGTRLAVASFGYTHECDPGRAIIQVWDHAGQEVTVFEGHSKEVNCLAFSPDGSLIASASDDGTVKVWHIILPGAAETADYKVLRGHPNPIQTVVFSPDGKQVATADGTFWKPGMRMQLELWDAETGKTERVLDDGSATMGPHGGIGLTGVVFSPDGTRFAGVRWNQATVTVSDVASGKEVLTLRRSTSSVAVVAYSPDGRWIAGAGGEPIFDPEKGPPPVAPRKPGQPPPQPPGELKIWDASSGKMLLDLKGHTAPISKIAFSSDGKRLASFSRDGTLRLWDTATGKEVLSIKVRSVGDTGIAFRPGGKQIAAINNTEAGRTVKVFDAETGKELHEIKGGPYPLNEIAYSPDGKRLLIGARNGLIEVYDTDTQKGLLKIETQQGGGMQSFVLSPDGKRLATNGHDQTVKVWDAESGKLLRTFEGVFGAQAYSPDGKRLIGLRGITVIPDMPPLTVKVWDAATGQLIRTHEFKGNGIAALAYSGDGKRLAAAVSTFAESGQPFVGELRVWDAATGSEIRTITGINGWILGLAFSHDGKRLAAGAGDQHVRVWDVDTGKELRAIQGGWLVSLSADGKRVAIGSMWGMPRREGEADTNAVQILDVETGKEIRALPHPAGVSSVAFSPNGKQLVTVSGTLQVWDAETGKELLKVNAPTHRATFSADGKWLACVTPQRDVVVRDAATGKGFYRLRLQTESAPRPQPGPPGMPMFAGYDHRGNPAAISPDGKWLGVVVLDGSAVQLWDAASLPEAGPQDAEEGQPPGKPMPIGPEPAPPSKRTRVLARFRFDGDAKNEGQGKADFELKNTAFKENALYLNGQYEVGGGQGYRAVCQTPELDYSAFTVALRFKAEEFGQPKTNLFTGGKSYRWFGMHRSDTGNLTITLNNQRFSHEITDAPLEAAKWTVVACGVDVSGRKVVVYLNGKKVADIDLPKDFELEIVQSDEKDSDKVWTFTNYSNARVFHGLVDELILYGKLLSPEELSQIPLRP